MQWHFPNPNPNDSSLQWAAALISKDLWHSNIYLRVHKISFPKLTANSWYPVAGKDKISTSPESQPV